MILVEQLFCTVFAKHAGFPAPLAAACIQASRSLFCRRLHLSTGFSRRWCSVRRDRVAAAAALLAAPQSNECRQQKYSNILAAGTAFSTTWVQGLYVCVHASLSTCVRTPRQGEQVLSEPWILGTDVFHANGRVHLVFIGPQERLAWSPNVQLFQDVCRGIKNNFNLKT